MNTHPTSPNDGAEQVEGDASTIPGAVPAPAAPAPSAEGVRERESEGVRIASAPLPHTPAPPLPDFLATVAAALKARGFWSVTIAADGIAELETNERTTVRTDSWDTVLDVLDLCEVADESVPPSALTDPRSQNPS